MNKNRFLPLLVVLFVGSGAAPLGLCQLLVIGGLAWAAYALTTALPYWPIDPSLAVSPCIGGSDELGPWLEDAEINRDRNLRLQYLAGLGINRYEQDLICRQMLSYLAFPEELFVGSEDSLAWLRQRIVGR